MALWSLLMVNTSSVGSFEATRVSHTDVAQPEPDLICRYRIRVDGRTLGEVEHRYGDGPWVLLRLGLSLQQWAETSEFRE